MMNENFKGTMVKLGKPLLIILGLPLVLPMILLICLIDLILGQPALTTRHSKHTEDYWFNALWAVLVALLVTLCSPLYILAALVDLFLPKESSLVLRISSAIDSFFPEQKYVKTEEPEYRHYPCATMCMLASKEVTIVKKPLSSIGIKDTWSAERKLASEKYVDIHFGCPDPDGKTVSKWDKLKTQVTCYFLRLGR